jgi:1-acyl-sn-glycerol-3-phosphate acyltransferase
MLWFFDRYVPRYLARRFHRVHLWGRADDIEVPCDAPVIFVMTHASWWDVLIGYYLARLVLDIESYAPMDEAQLRRYRVLARLGAYSIDRFSAGGLRDFVRYTSALLKPGRAVWVTPQGEITSAWRRPVAFQPGVGHLVRRGGRLATVPVAVAYEFLEEPRPEIFVKLGPPRRFDDARDTPAAITRRLEADLEQELSAIQEALIARDLAPFTVLLQGATSVSLVYDRVRRLRARMTGRPDPARHGAVVSDPRRGPR